MIGLSLILLFVLIFKLSIVIIIQIVINSAKSYADNHLVSTLEGNNSFISWLTFIQVLLGILICNGCFSNH